MENKIHITSLALTLLFLSCVLMPFQLSAEPNSLVKLATLYANGHPVTGELGRIVSIAASDQGLLFVSFSEYSDPDGQTLQELDVWSLSDPENPQLMNRVDFSDPGERGIPDDPSFLAPHDLKVFNKHLVFWRNFELFSYSIGSDGSLAQVFHSDFADDLNTGLNRLSYGGHYAASERQLLTNNEFLRLLDQLDYSIAEDLISENVLIDLQDPANPFLVRQSQVLGKNYRIFDPAPSGALNGLPAQVEVSDDLRSLTVTYSQQLRETHVSALWAPILREVFGRRVLSRTLAQLTSSVVTNLSLPKLARTINAQLDAGLNLPANTTLTTRFNASYDQAALLSTLLATFHFSLNDSLELALQKVVSTFIDSELTNSLSNLVLTRVLEQWTKTLFQKVPRFARSVSSKVDDAFSARLKARGFDKYLVDAVMGPLIDLPPLFRVRLGSLINEISNSDAGQTLSAALNLFNTVIPARRILAAAGFDTPRCFRIPNDARNFLKLLLTTGGARLNVRNYAFIEFLKLYAHYQGSNNYTRFIQDARRELAALHDSLSQDFALTFLRGIDPTAALGDGIKTILARAQQTIDMKPIIVDAIVEGITAQLIEDGIDVSLSVREILEARGLYTEQARLPAGVTLATNAQFSASISALRVGSEQVTALLQVSGSVSVGDRANAQPAPALGVQRAIPSLRPRTHGAISLQSTVESALALLIVQKLSPYTVGQYVESLIGNALANLSESVPLPSFIETAQRAAQGNCIAQYQVALLGISAVPGVGELAVAAEAALLEAQTIGLNFITEQLLRTFLSQIFSAAAEHYPSWNLKLTQASEVIPVNQITARNVRFIDPHVMGDKLAVLLRDLGAGGWIPGYSRALDLVIADSIPGAAGATSVSLGDWDAVQSVASNDRGFMAVYGQRLNSSEFPEPALTFVDVLSEGNPVHELQGDDATIIGGLEQLEVLPSSQIFIASTQEGAVTIYSSAPR